MLEVDWKKNIGEGAETPKSANKNQTQSQELEAIKTSQASDVKACIYI